MKYDYIILGAGIYGLYAAILLSRKKIRTAVIEIEPGPFRRASYINQARVHNGYHYPRSLSTAIKSASYFERFSKDFNFAINNSFRKIYAIASSYSLTSARNFKRFCENAAIPVTAINPSLYFNARLIEEAFETRECAFDPLLIRDYLTTELENTGSTDIFYSASVERIETTSGLFQIYLNGDRIMQTDHLLNATYASVNQLNKLADLDTFGIKYEICEIILCDVSENIKNAGLTIMDGPFFSVMPFGFSGLHSLSAVTFTPHLTSYNDLPVFKCQEENPDCTSFQLQDCNTCKAKPVTAWTYMNKMTEKYLQPDVKITYNSSLFSIKPILKSSELDDSRPTLIRKHRENPCYYSVLSGKINTIYDLEEIIP